MIDIIKEIEQACAAEKTLDGLKKAFTSFKPRIDPLSEDRREQTRIVYWNHKHRIERV